ncbi:MAG TPA: hypothetical protein VM164_01015 [Burkholderiales bacterium]|nr:hypothetical protein [Burkholderiales bacterium]
MRLTSALLAALIAISSSAFALEGKPPADKPPVTPAGAPPGPPIFVLGLVGAVVAIAVIAGLVNDNDNPATTGTR